MCEIKCWKKNALYFVLDPVHRCYSTSMCLYLILYIDVTEKCACTWSCTTISLQLICTITSHWSKQSSKWTYQRGYRYERARYATTKQIHPSPPRKSSIWTNLLEKVQPIQRGSTQGNNGINVVSSSIRTAGKSNRTNERPNVQVRSAETRPKEPPETKAIKRSRVRMSYVSI